MDVTGASGAMDWLIMMTVSIVVGVTANLLTPRLVIALSTVSDVVARRRLSKLERNLKRVREGVGSQTTFLSHALLLLAPTMIIGLITTIMFITSLILLMGFLQISLASDSALRDSILSNSGSYAVMLIIITTCMLLVNFTWINMGMRLVRFLRNVRDSDEYTRDTEAKILALKARLAANGELGLDP